MVLNPLLPPSTQLIPPTNTPNIEFIFPPPPEEESSSENVVAVPPPSAENVSSPVLRRPSTGPHRHERRRQSPEPDVRECAVGREAEVLRQTTRGHHEHDLPGQIQAEW